MEVEEKEEEEEEKIEKQGFQEEVRETKRKEVKCNT